VGLVVGGKPLGDFAKIAIRFRHDKAGIDYEQARLRWISAENPLLDKAPYVETFIGGTNDWQTVVFNLENHKAFDPADDLRAIFLSLPVGTYPGLTVWIDEVGSIEAGDEK